MNLSAILAFYCFGLGALTPTSQSGAQPAAPTSDSSTQQTQSKDSQPQAEPKQSPEPAPPPSSGSSETTKPAAPPKPPHAKARRHKKTVSTDCSSTTAANTATGNPAAPPGPETSSSSSTALPPCPTPKKVVRNGGSNEPSIQLIGGGTAEQTAQQRTLDQLTTATTENLKKIEGLQLNPTQQDMVSQIKQFMDQSKTAVAAGDLERGNNLAMKAHLLSDELVKP
jgi:hypothetical protein